jgi:hypothetical protein
MSSGGVYSLLTNDGKQDQMLMATEALSRRLAAIRKARENMANPTPTLADIEKTHIIFMNSHFKPFAAMGFEYNKVVANSPTLGSKVQFSIPLRQLLPSLVPLLTALSIAPCSVGATSQVNASSKRCPLMSTVTLSMNTTQILTTCTANTA